jgi:hypothetical protein
VIEGGRHKEALLDEVDAQDDDDNAGECGEVGGVPTRPGPEPGEPGPPERPGGRVKAVDPVPKTVERRPEKDAREGLTLPGVS